MKLLDELKQLVAKYEMELGQEVDKVADEVKEDEVTSTDTTVAGVPQETTPEQPAQEPNA